MASAASSISVAVRIRPFSDREKQQLASGPAPPTYFNSNAEASSSTGLASHLPLPKNNSLSGPLRKIVKVLDDRILVFDPPETNAISVFQKQLHGGQQMGKRFKDMRFCFDRVFDDDCGQEEVYEGTAKELVDGVLDGFNSTVFAYGATGCGKTHTISGSPSQPGIVFLIMKDLFARMAAKAHDTDFALTISYLEIYNETIRDLFAPEAGPLALRELDGKAVPAGLSTKTPENAHDVVEWILAGNANRTVNATEANATSSRSHAVLSVNVTQKPRAGGITENHAMATLSVIDLAGSERASVTKNHGDRLIEGANINRSLLALGNCINALCDPRKRGHVPYRDSKLTRLLKPSLGGNCKTVMIVCVSPSSQHYDETHNTLQYANRAKEIKTKVVRNVVSVDRHVQQYVKLIMELRTQIEDLKKDGGKRDADARALEKVADEKAKVDVEASVRKVKGSWEAALTEVTKSERARSEKQAVDAMLSILRQWKSTAFDSAGVGGTRPKMQASMHAAAPFISKAQSMFDAFVTSLASTSQSLAAAASRGDTATQTYSAFVSSIARSLASKSAEAVAHFNKEVRILDLELELAKSQAREQGAAEGARVQARAIAAMWEARSKIGGALEDARADPASEVEGCLKRLVDGIDNANRGAFLSLAGAALPAVGAGAGSISAMLPPVAVGSKRNMGSRSPLLPDSTSVGGSSFDARPGKAARGSLAATAPVPSPARARRSPRKVGGGRANGILKQGQSPRKRGIGYKDSDRSDASTTASKKGVQWRDETGDGWEIEDVRDMSANALSGASDLSSLSAGDSGSLSGTPQDPRATFGQQPSITVSSSNTLGPLASIIKPYAVPALPTPVNPFTSGGPVTSSTVGVTSGVGVGAGRARPSMMGSLGRGAASRPLGVGGERPRLPSLDEDSDASFSFARHEDSTASIRSSASSAPRRPALGDLSSSLRSSSGGNGSFSMAGTSNGLFAPIVRSREPSPPKSPRRVAAAVAAKSERRNSNIGPQRSTKPNRRTSFISSNQNEAPSSASSSTAGAGARRASRAAGPLVYQPGSPRKSPKKSTQVGRRASLALATSSGGGWMSSTAARAKARRESGATGAIAAPATTAAAGLTSRPLPKELTAAANVWR